MSTKQDQASGRSRKTVSSQLTMGETVSVEGEVGEAQRIKTACPWARREQAMEGARERISAGVVAQSMEGTRMKFLWRVLSVIEGSQRSQEEGKKVRTGP